MSRPLNLVLIVEFIFWPSLDFCTLSLADFCFWNSPIEDATLEFSDFAALFLGIPEDADPIFCVAFLAAWLLLP